MVKGFNFTAMTSVPVAAFFVAASLVGVARAGDKVQLTGHWNYNAVQSDDAGQKVHEAQVNNEHGVNDAAGGGADPTAGTGYPGGGGGYPGTMGPTIGGMGGRGGMGGMGGPGGMGRGTRQGTRGPEVTSEEWDRLAANPKYLQIEQHSDQFVVSNDTDQGQTFYPDGKKHDDKDADGKKITTKSSWEGDAFVAETKLSRSQKITETYRLSGDGKQLYVTTRFEDTSLNGPVLIRRVYDAAKTQSR
ncbi:MAG TPA: hypothetical protein VEN79_12715 [Terriglobia bacterium]|nr:hypothetical protein [Terriglobia bacterium]